MNLVVSKKAKSNLLLLLMIMIMVLNWIKAYLKTLMSFKVHKATIVNQL